MTYCIPAVCLQTGHFSSLADPGFSGLNSSRRAGALVYDETITGQHDRKCYASFDKHDLLGLDQVACRRSICNLCLFLMRHPNKKPADASLRALDDCRRKDRQSFAGVSRRHGTTALVLIPAPDHFCGNEGGSEASAPAIILRGIRQTLRQGRRGIGQAIPL